MSKNHIKDVEFEKNKQDFLLMAKQASSTKKNIDNKDDHKAIWELEILEYRKRKSREKFMMIGSVCGYISLIISLLLLINHFMNLF